MDTERFEQIVEEQLALCTDVLITKAREYASDTDRLHNFKVSAVLQGITQRESLSGLMAKHTVSIYDMCASGKEYPQAVWDEKLTDHMNYLILLRAIVAEERDALAQGAQNA